MWKWRSVETALFLGSYNQLHVWSCESPLTSLEHGFSPLSCKNKCFCLVAINVGRKRDIQSIGSPPLLAREKAPEGGEDGFQQPQKSLCSFVGSGYTQQPSVWINKTRWAHLQDLWVQPRCLAYNHSEVRRACCFPKERWRKLPSIM